MIPAIITSRNVKYNTSQTVCFGRTYFQPKYATIQIIKAVAKPCNAVTTFILTPQALKISPIKYNIATAPIR